LGKEKKRKEKKREGSEKLKPHALLKGIKSERGLKMDSGEMLSRN